jgi:Flp pilus assembly CpaF family ATPase/MinD-like ATPase involved in chromosome partitioning or flagellar assembly
VSSATFAFIGAKGGSGTTTICAELAKMAGPSIAVVDGDLSGRRNLAVLCDAVHLLDVSREASTIAIARCGGITVAELAPTYEAGFTIDLDDVERLAASLQETRLVIADLPLPFAAPVRPFVVRATRFVVVTEPTLLGITSASTIINELGRFGVPRSRIVALLNVRGGPVLLSRNEVEHTLECKTIAELPPMPDRNFGKALGKLLEALRSIAAERPLESLLPSAKNAIHDRRLHARETESERALGGAAPAADFAIAGDEEAAGEPPARGDVSLRERLKLRIHAALAENVDLLDASRARTDANKLAEVRAKIDETAQRILAEYPQLGSTEEIAKLKREIANEALGLGPLEDLMSDDSVTEIMVNGYATIFVERRGLIEYTGRCFTSEQQLRLVIERIIAPLGRRLDESVPMVDARLPDGSRVNAIIDPLSIDGTTLTIRRFGKRRLSAQDLIEKGSASPPILEFLEACIQARLNIVISGGTGSGKTTFLNILSGYIPTRDRIITIEDAAELRLNQPHVVRLEARPTNIEGRGEIKIRDLVRNALRMRPDRIIVGECRGGEALDMLQAMNTGHDGSLTTAHANSPRDALARLETMVLMAGFDLPMRAIREQIASAIDLVIQTERMRDGSRKITSVTEVVGMEGDVVTMQELVRFASRGVDANGGVIGDFVFTGVQPQHLRRFEEYGIAYDVRRLSTLERAASSW